MLYTKVLSIANIQITMKTFRGIKIGMLYWRNYVKSGCATAGFHCMASAMSAANLIRKLRPRLNNFRLLKLELTHWLKYGFFFSRNWWKGKAFESQRTEMNESINEDEKGWKKVVQYGSKEVDRGQVLRRGQDRDLQMCRMMNMASYCK